MVATRQSWQHRRVLVTGATGFIGSWLVRDLNRRGADVTAFVLDQDPRSMMFSGPGGATVRIVNGALEDFRAVRRAIGQTEADTVFHLGAQTLVGPAERDPLGTLETNVRGSYHVLEACRLSSATVGRVVVASSDKAYGESDALPYVESTPLRGARPYEVSKSCTDLITQAYHETYGLPTAIARCGNVYGGGDLNWSRIVPGTIRSLLQGERPVLRSDGTPRRDYLYVDDVVRAYRLLAENLHRRSVRGRAFNFGTQAPLSALEILRHVARAMGRPKASFRIRKDAPGEIHDQFLSSELAARHLGWRPTWSLEDGLKETIAWYRRFLKKRAPP